jgi:two-component system C4-dicarboxylate transport sensor histidine kinase DctB
MKSPTSDDVSAPGADDSSASGSADDARSVDARRETDDARSADARQMAELKADNERLRELLTAAGRLAEFGRFAAQQIHELRQPLFAIKGLSQLLLEKEQVELDEVLDFARHISDQSERLTILVSDLRQLSIPAPAPTKRRSEFGPILVRVTALLEYRLRKTGATLRTHVAPDLPPLAAAPHGLEQILINLVGNALDAVTGVASPRIQVRAKRVTHDPRLAEIEVADNGSGVAKTARAKLFETFFTTKGAEQGTGLGLAVSREIARSVGGDLTLLEQPGAWPEPAVTVFRLTIPVSQEL